MITTSQLLSSLQDILNEDYFRGLPDLDISNYASQTWADNTYQEGKTLSTTSDEGSSLSYFSQSSRIDAEKNDLNVNLKGSDGGSLIVKVSSTRPLNDGDGIHKLSTQTTWQYVGDKSSTADNVSLSFTVTANDTTTTASNGITTFAGGSAVSVFYNYANGSGNQLLIKGSDKYKITWSNSGASMRPIDTNTTLISQFSLTNIDSDSSSKISFSGLIYSDKANIYQEYALKNVSFLYDSITIASKTFSYKGAYLFATEANPTNELSLLDTALAAAEIKLHLLPLALKDDNTITGSADNDTINAAEGNDTVSGGAGDDEITGGLGNDKLVGGDGSDTLTGGSGNDVLEGGKGIDSVNYASAVAGVKIDLLKGTATSIGSPNASGIGTDTIKTLENIIASDYGDKLTGNADANNVDAGSGNDTLDGGLGKDTLTGGDGADTFIFSTKFSAKNIDVIDFEVGIDKIQLSSKIFTKLKTATNFLALGSASNSPTHFVIYDATTGVISYDADGNGKSAQPIGIVIVGSSLSITALDFEIIS